MTHATHKRRLDCGERHATRILEGEPEQPMKLDGYVTMARDRGG
jgi:hypothetical protein